MSYLVFLSPFSTAITSLGEERANLSAFRTFVRFALVWFCLFPLPFGVWEGLRFVIVALPGFFLSVKNSNEVLYKFKSKNFKASKLSTYDFSTLCYLIILKKINLLI